MSLATIRNARPRNADYLHKWIESFTGVRIARTAVCPGHQSPFDAFSHQVIHRPRQALWMGSRGSGKSFLSAIDTHLSSRWNRNHGTRILGGSAAQSRQIYDALKEVVRDGSGDMGSDGDTIHRLLKREAEYRNGSTVEILACSDTSVRGPHVASLKLDEVDEIGSDHRDSAAGMCMEKNGVSASILMTSTWHRVGGPMGELMEKGDSGAFPVFRFCVFEVLERCPRSRSGPPVAGPDLYLNCPACPIKKYCHSHVVDRKPKAKRSDGHYAIDALIQKLDLVSARVFESDYLCSGPKADGIWFPGFDDSMGLLSNVTTEAEYDPAVPAHVSVDSGVFTGATFGQVRNAKGKIAVNIFADFLSEGLSASDNASQIVAFGKRWLGDGMSHRVSTDPSGGSRNAIGPTVIGEYHGAGLKGRTGIERWPLASIADSLATIEALLTPASGVPRLTIHPRCKHLISAFRTYRRAKRGGQWMDYPQDPQHPAEDVMDALRGMLKVEFPKGLNYVAPRAATGGPGYSELNATAHH